jgi:hypothetical protein
MIALQRLFPGLAAACIVLAGATAALPAQEASPPAAPTDSPPEWSFNVSAFDYFIPDEDDIGLGIVTADRGPIHLEGRWNYEAEGAGSAFFGWTFSMGDEVAVDVTPMLGGVFGEIEAIAPGVELNLDWKGLNFYYEGEYVIDLGDDEGDFAYGWSELTWAPADWFRAGMVGQRTRLYDTGLDVQRGLLVGFTYRWLDVAGYFFNPSSDDAFTVVSLAVEF